MWNLCSILVDSEYVIGIFFTWVRIWNGIGIWEISSGFSIPFRNTRWISYSAHDAVTTEKDVILLIVVS